MTDGFAIGRRALMGGGAALLLTARLSAMAPPLPRERQFNLSGPKSREISISEWAPVGKAKGTILFSHGAASAPRFYDRLLSPWAAAGFRVLAPLHVDSLEHPRTKDYPGLASWKARIEDMHVLSAHLGHRPCVATGHSYGGLVALTLGGAAANVPEGISGPLALKPVRAAVAFSPPAPIPALCTAEGYARLAVPALIQTGTKDIVPGMTDEKGWRGHLVPYEAAAAGGDRYGLVLDGVDHYFGGAICRYDLPGPPQLQQLADAVRISNLFLATFGQSSKTARKRLNAQISAQLPVMLLHK